MRVRVELAKLGPNLGGQPAVDEAAGGRPIGEPRVHPEGWVSIFSRCDLPLPKQPLTHADSCFGVPRLAR